MKDYRDYEYCVMMKNYPQVPHRRPPERDYETDEPITDPLKWCEEWVRQWYEELPNSHSDLFYVARRPVQKWEKYDDD